MMTSEMRRYRSGFTLIEVAISALVFVLLDAVDVAFTEAAVGAGISTVLMLATLSLTRKHEEKRPAHQPWVPLVVVTVTGIALAYGTLDIPGFSDPEAPSHQHVALNGRLPCKGYSQG